MIIGCVQTAHFGAKRACTLVALLLAALKNQHVNWVGTARHDQARLPVQRGGRTRPDTGVGNELERRSHKDGGIHRSWIVISRDFVSDNRESTEQKRLPIKDL